MTFLQAYQKGITLVKTNTQADTCVFDISCLFEKVFHRDRRRLSPEDGPALKQDCELFFSLCRRYLDGEPLQYLLGEWEFFGLPFYVGPGVLIPQPDTEILVETGLKLIQGITGPTIYDLCSGSGCVAVSLAHNRRDAMVYALELYEQAYAYLEKNIRRSGCSNLSPLLADVLSPPPLPSADLIVSNPPYISAHEMASLPPQVKQEPASALCGGEDGLTFYRSLPALYYPYLKPGGWLALEAGYQQAPSVRRLLKENGYVQIKSIPDLAGIERVTIGKKE